MKRAFTLIELLVVIAIIAVLIALSLPVMRLAREAGHETACRSNLHQMTVMLKTYCSDHDGLFPDPTFLYNSKESFNTSHSGQPSRLPYGSMHPWTCRWHDAEIGPAGPLLRDHKELQGALIPYLGNPKVLLCRTAVRAYLERGCNNQDPNKPRRPQPHFPGGGPGGGRPAGMDIPEPNEPLALVPQYCYTMNGNLHRTFLTGTLGGGRETPRMRGPSESQRSAGRHKSRAVLPRCLPSARRIPGRSTRNHDGRRRTISAVLGEEPRMAP